LRLKNAVSSLDRLLGFGIEGEVWLKNPQFFHDNSGPVSGVTEVAFQ
jgi:hypothetical protein